MAEQENENKEPETNLTVEEPTKVVTTVENETKDKENLSVLEDIKKTINEIRQGVRSKIASIWIGFKNIISKGFDKLFGTEIKGDKTTTQNSPATNSTKPTESTTSSKSTSTGTDQSQTSNHETSTEIPKIEECVDFKKVMETYAKEIKDPVKNVLYPCSGFMSINSAFKDSKVTYLDIDENAVKAHKEAGHTAVKEDIRNYKPQETPDLTVLLNPHAEEQQIKKLLDHIEKDKHIICNNYHRTAELLNGNADFKLVGVISPDGTKMDKEKLEEYFKEVESDQEFKQNDPVQYEKAVTLIKEKNGNAEKDILKQFKELTKGDTTGLNRIPFKKGGNADRFATFYFIFKRITATENQTTPAIAKPSANNNSNPVTQAA